MFHCKTYDCKKISERSCILRQNMEQKETLRIAATVGYDPYISCRNCEQGKQIQKEAEEMTDRICDKEGCGKPHKAKGLCDKHYSESRQKLRTEKAREGKKASTEETYPKKYKPNSVCDACGDNMASTKYHTTEHEMVCGAPEVGKESRIERTCTRCGYQWEELPLYRVKDESQPLT